MTSVVVAGKVVLPLEGLIDMDKEIARLEKNQINYKASQIEQIKVIQREFCK